MPCLENPPVYGGGWFDLVKSLNQIWYFISALKHALKQLVVFITKHDVTQASNTCSKLIIKETITKFMNFHVVS